MKLYERAELVRDAASFADFLEALARDRAEAVEREAAAPSSPHGPDAGGWENRALDEFLDGAASWFRDSDFDGGAFEENPWRTFARVLFAGKHYE